MNEGNSTQIIVTLSLSEIAQLEVISKARGLAKEDLVAQYVREGIRRDVHHNAR